MVSEARNLKVADSTNHMVDLLVKTILEQHPDFQELDEFRVGLNKPANINIQVALENTALIFDLKPLLIIEKTGGARRFITSDNPLIRYNSFYLSNNYPGGFSYTSRGAQFFFPISSHKCILLYDEMVYDIPDQQDHILFLKKARDVDQLNELFYLNAHNSVFFNQKTKKEYIEGLHQKSRKEPRISDLKRETNTFKSENGSKLLNFGHNRVRKKFHFSWMKTSRIADSFVIPAHMGGIHRLESIFIRRFLAKKELEYEQQRPPSGKKFFRS